MPDEIEKITKKVIDFRNKRGWKNAHTPKNSAISLSLEAGELLECFQWKGDREHIEKNFQQIKDELADVFYWVLLIAYDLDIDLNKALREKLRKNAIKYPVEKKE